MQAKFVQYSRSGSFVYFNKKVQHPKSIYQYVNYVLRYNMYVKRHIYYVEYFTCDGFYDESHLNSLDIISKRNF